MVIINLHQQFLQSEYQVVVEVVLLVLHLIYLQPLHIVVLVELVILHTEHLAEVEVVV